MTKKIYKAKPNKTGKKWKTFVAKPKKSKKVRIKKWQALT
jgi:hypothetical protein